MFLECKFRPRRSKLAVVGVASSSQLNWIRVTPPPATANLTLDWGEAARQRMRYAAFAPPPDELCVRASSFIPFVNDAYYLGLSNTSATSSDSQLARLATLVE